jgi:hypothetical protein
MGHSFHEKSVEVPHEGIHAEVVIFTQAIFYLQEKNLCACRVL